MLIKQSHGISRDGRSSGKQSGAREKQSRDALTAQPELTPAGPLQLERPSSAARSGAKMVGLYTPIVISHWMWASPRARLLC